MWPHPPVGMLIDPVNAGEIRSTAQSCRQPGYFLCSSLISAVNCTDVGIYLGFVFMDDWRLEGRWNVVLWIFQRRLSDLKILGCKHQCDSPSTARPCKILTSRDKGIAMAGQHFSFQSVRFWESVFVGTFWLGPSRRRSVIAFTVLGPNIEA